MGAKQVRGFIPMNRFYFFILLAVLALSCKKSTTDPSQDFFPPVQVNTSVNLLLPQNINLSIAQGYVYLPEGYRGIIVFHTTDDHFVAFDRACPYQTSDSCARISVDSSGVWFRCGTYSPSWKPCCNSKFDPVYGTVLTLPAKRSLKQYYTSKQDQVIYISSSPF